MGNAVIITSSSDKNRNVFTFLSESTKSIVVGVEDTRRDYDGFTTEMSVSFTPDEIRNLVGALHYVLEKWETYYGG